MIFGIGTDLVEVARVRAAWQRFGEHFARRVLMAEELEGFRRAPDAVRFLATRFAAKEAIVKALGTGFRHGMWLRDSGHVPDARGKPCVIFSARGQALCRRLGAGDAFVSLSDEAGLVLAFAVILRAAAPS
ncbi:MAG: holo-ACP synthase [Gammaproteobacteria bacterium]|nr:holo-ACP synthase [Gammaproteobacteria bacterium]MBU6508866.1 holo-ACP synthase [Gammaproteobacteria bacterium]MDE1983489.1 holo-ACP synthase [Gammaproteobacteria bacterium]MDE2109401.1 holo-ACP synthase [Gammaproteobacteria bacterium]MDE2460204.1 holo-ACP synthase [Gammaproteobacteria bacterium]